MSKIPVGEGFKFSDDSEQAVAGIPEADENGIQYTRGDAAWDPSLGAIIAANLTLLGSEPTTTFTLVATNSRDLTLALASTVGSDYLLTLHNQSDKRSISWTVKTQGGDTINGGTSFSITTGETYLVERSSSTEYFVSNAVIDESKVTVETTLTDNDEILFFNDASGTLALITKTNFESSLAEQIAVATDSTLTGDGTSGDPLSLATSHFDGDHSSLNLDDGTNPHSTTQSDVGLANADNTSDADKPVSTAQQTALDLKADKSNVLELDNTTSFTPDADFEPATKKYVDDNGGLGYTLQWGGNMQTAGNYAMVSGQTNGGQNGGLSAGSEAIVLADGTLDRLSYNSGTGDATTVSKIWKNGAVAHTFTWVSSGDIETGIGLSVVTGDLIAIEYDAGMKPAGSIYVAYIA